MIPKIIHRTIQRETNQVIDACWEQVKKLHPDWELRTWYDEDEYPHVGEHLPRCTKGAFRADLIRLDVVYRFGGFYLDSDIWLIKSLDSLLDNEAVCAGEFTFAFGNLAFGATPNHPAMKAALDTAILRLDDLKTSEFFVLKNEGKRSAWGPYVHTLALQERNDVTRLPQESFQPFLLNNVLTEEQKLMFPLWRPLTSGVTEPAPPITDLTYGVHLNNWSWNPKNDWETRKQAK